jgi:hypothetical protein
MGKAGTVKRVNGHKVSPGPGTDEQIVGRAVDRTRGAMPDVAPLVTTIGAWGT